MKTLCRKIGLLLLGAFFISRSAGAQLPAVSFEHLDSLQAQEKRMVVVMIYTQWCQYCIAMKQTTFAHKDIKPLLQQQFYLVMLDAEEKNTIRWRGRSFHFKPTGTNTGVHELAVQLGTSNGELPYPTLVFLNPQLEILYQHQGFLSVADLKKILLALQQKKNSTAP